MSASLPYVLSAIFLSHDILSESFGNLQGPSPDEVALVEGGRQLGFEFVARDRTTITVNMLGDEVSMCSAVRTSCLDCSAAEILHLSVP